MKAKLLEKALLEAVYWEKGITDEERENCTVTEAKERLVARILEKYKRSTRIKTIELGVNTVVKSGITRVGEIQYFQDYGKTNGAYFNIYLINGERLSFSTIVRTKPHDEIAIDKAIKSVLNKRQEIINALNE